jgi:acetyltransferase-like isoleucine patch superfamily enzyme
MLKIGEDVKIHETARIEVESGSIGDRSVIGPYAVIEGRHVVIGHEAWIDHSAWIGGGSCNDPGSKLTVGDFLHMGRDSHLNQGRGLSIGHEFGCGIATRVFTHGAYESAWDGFPVQWGSVSIGDRVWLPNAWVNPGVKIGSNIVVAAMSLVNSDLPDGCLAGGIPCKVLRENVYPRKLSADEKRALFDRIFSEASAIYSHSRGTEPEEPVYERVDEDTFSLKSTVIDLRNRKIEGDSTEFSEILKNQLRRNGIRFRFKTVEGRYVSW